MTDVPAGEKCGGSPARLLPSIPSWSWETRLRGGDGLGPDYHLFTILPLYRHSLAAGL